MLDRNVFAIGRQKRQHRTLATRCAWCGKWHSAEDERAAENGAMVSHGICPSCVEDAGFPAPDGWDPDGEAA